MQKLNLPEYQHKIKTENSKKSIFDFIRKKYVALTPEEHVRQSFIRFLIEEKNYPKNLIGVEIAVPINDMKKRADIVLYNRNGNVTMITECKAPSVKITQKTIDQIARYNLILKAELLFVTNGINHFCLQLDVKNQKYKFLKEIPDYNEAN